MASKPVKRGIKPSTKLMKCDTWIQTQEAEDSMFQIGNKSSKMTLILEDGVRVPEYALRVARKPKTKLFEEKVSTKKSRAGTVARGRKMDEIKQRDRGRSPPSDGGSLGNDASGNSKSSKVLLEDRALVQNDAFKRKSKSKSIRNTRSLSRGRNKASAGGRSMSAINKKQQTETKLARKAQQVQHETKQQQGAHTNQASKKQANSLRFKSPTRGRSKAVDKILQQQHEKEDIGSLWDTASRNSKSGKVILEDGAMVPKEAYKKKISSIRFTSPIRLTSPIRRTRGQSKTRTKISGNTSKSRALKKGSDAVAKSTKSKAGAKSNTRAKSKSSAKSNRKSLRAWDDLSNQDALFKKQELFTLAEQLVLKGSDWFNSLGSNSYETSQIDTRSDDDEVSEERNNIGGNWFTWNSVKDESGDGTREQEDDEATTGEKIKDWVNWIAAVGSSDDDVKTYGSGWDDDFTVDCESGEVLRYESVPQGLYYV